MSMEIMLNDDVRKLIKKKQTKKNKWQSEQHEKNI